MGRLSIIIADCDADYLKSLERFLIANYPQRFEIFTFSSRSKLSDYLNSVGSIDILVLGQQIYQKDLKIEKAMLTLLLSENWAGECSRQTCSDSALSQIDEANFVSKKPELIDKYQHMDRFVSEILRLYAANSNNGYRITATKGNTRIVSVLSPSGGLGKSSIAAGCSVLCAGRGISSFYLNMENIPSTNLFFYGDSTQSFSNVVFHLKGEQTNLSLRLEGAKSIDIGSRVHYFKPPENIQELNELTQQDAVRLLEEFKNSGVYNVVFVDTSSGFSPINTAIMKNSDIMLLVMSPDRCSEFKLKEFMAGLALLGGKGEAKLTGKIIPVFNRIAEKAEEYKPFLERVAMGKYQGFLDIWEPPMEISDYSCPGYSDRSSDLIENGGFLSELSRITDYILGRTTDGVNNCFGGEFSA